MDYKEASLFYPLNFKGKERKLVIEIKIENIFHTQTY